MIQIIQGKKSVFTVKLNDAATGERYDLTPVTVLTACFERQDGTSLTLGIGTGIVVLSAIYGRIQVSITAAQSALLSQVDNATLALSITTTGDPVGVLIPNAYSVVQSPC